MRRGDSPEEVRSEGVLRHLCDVDQVWFEPDVLGVISVRARLPLREHRQSISSSAEVTSNGRLLVTVDQSGAGLNQMNE